MKVLFVLAAGLLSASMASADAPAPPPKPTLPKGTPAEQVAALTMQHEQAMNAFLKLYEAARTEKEQESLEFLYPDSDSYATLLVRIAEQNATDPAAVDAMLWVVRNGKRTSGDAASPHARAKEILVRDYLKHAKIGGLCMELRRDARDANSVQIIRRVLTDNPNKEAQAAAAFALAKALRTRAILARTLKNADPKLLARFEEGFGKDNLADLRRGDAAALEQEADELLERIINDEDYAATSIRYRLSPEKLGYLADRELFEVRHLQPGMHAPEIEGEDIDGKPMKLSDFRGKVVLLDFWGHWCGPCQGLYPRIRSLVKKFEGKPFAVVGVNSDANRETIKDVIAIENITWRSFWDEGAQRGPIHSQWNINGWPTMYLIDHKGTIVGRDAADELIERTVQEAEAEPAAPAPTHAPR
ncbi:MAG TPA: TlpA disulfide reductase family protein [Pirellulales bacterium]|nr:TlpA disulfide reductase family protein [Pirellulales bacterium]